MSSTMVESDSSAFSDNRGDSIIRCLHEYHLSTKHQRKRIHEDIDASDYLMPPVSDDEYDVALLGRDSEMHINTLELRAEWMQIGLNQEPPAWQTQLKYATKVEDVVLVIKLFGQSSIANRLDYLHSLPVDEPYQKPMNLESVKGFALFIMNNAYLPYPDIVVNPDGHVTIEWDVAGCGTLILEFISLERVEYLEVPQQPESARQRQYNSGRTSIDDVTNAVKLWPYTR